MTDLPPIPTTEQREPLQPPLPPPSRPRRFIYCWDEKERGVDREGRQLSPKPRMRFRTATAHGAYTFSRRPGVKKPWKVWWRTTPTSSPGFAAFLTFEEGLAFIRSLR